MYALARWVSIIFHPMMTLMLAIGYAASTLLHGTDLQILLAATAASLVAIGTYVLVQVRRGAIGNIDVSRREERPRFYLIGIASSVLSLALFWQLRMPTRVLEGTAISTALLIAGFLVNMRLKASLHVAYTIFSLGLLWAVLPAGARILGIALVALMAWSRIVLKRHTPVETVAGALIGTVAACTYYLTGTSL